MTGTRPAKPGYPNRMALIAIRVLNLLSAACLLTAGTMFLANGRPGIAAFDLAGAALQVGAFVLCTKTAAIRRAKYVRDNRPRPDYALIASMEREVYGETFHHDGSPVADAFAFARDVGEMMAGASGVIRLRPLNVRLAEERHASRYCAKCHELDWRHRR